MCSVRPVFSCMTRIPPAFVRVFGPAWYPMSAALLSSVGMPTVVAPPRRGSSGRTVTGSVVALDGGVAYGTLGCGDAGCAAAVADPVAAARG